MKKINMLTITTKQLELDKDFDLQPPEDSGESKQIYVIDLPNGEIIGFDSGTKIGGYSLKNIILAYSCVMGMRNPLRKLSDSKEKRKVG